MNTVTIRITTLRVIGPKPSGYAPARVCCQFDSFAGDKETFEFESESLLELATLLTEWLQDRGVCWSNSTIQGDTDLLRICLDASDYGSNWLLGSS